MGSRTSWRTVVSVIGAAAAAAFASGFGGHRVLAAGEATAPAAGDYLRPEAERLRRLARQLAAIPRRRSFKSLPMILLRPEQWDNEALEAIISYDGAQIGRASCR